MSDSEKHHGATNDDSAKDDFSYERLPKAGISRRSLIRAAVVGAAGLPMASACRRFPRV